MTIRIIRALMATLTLLLLSGCSTTHHWQQQLTLVFATPDGEMRASVVHSMSVNIGWQITQMIIGDQGRIANIKGEALVADLGGGNVLFALIPSAFLAEQTGLLPYRNGMGHWIRRLPDQPPIVLTQHTGPGGDIRPTLVTFADLSDPNTLKIVDPDDLQATFGPGYALKTVTLTGTDAPRTQIGLKTLLPWLKARGRTHMYVVDRPNELAPPYPRRYSIRPASFDTELYN